MKKIMIFILAAILVISCDQIPVRPAQAFIDEVKEEVCPDRRINIFDLEYDQQGKVITLNGEMNSLSGHDSLLARLESEGYEVADKIALLPSGELQGKIYGVVNRSVANMRVEPSARTEMATQAILGVPIRVFKKGGNDYYVQTPDGYLGWMEGSAFTAMTPAEFNDWQEAEKIIYLADAGYVYSKTSCKSPIVGDITAKSFLKELRQEGDYVKVAYPDGREGYIKAVDCMNFNTWKDEIEISTESVLELAHTYMGRPYLWGGTSTKMLDCSGFIRTVMFLHGVYLPRDASQQVLVGKTVAEGNQELDKLKPGDLVFFGLYRENGSERITHVGIYLGDNKFIHEAGDVNILSFNPEDENYSEYRYNLFIRAKDVINHVGELGVERVADNPMFK
ncbi:MAG: C40 family peptidase [Candidatus Marinimicrobia bacterium]|nr:C40 family peptidase [Candidatus Neomarinimicrobiota bacterium]